MIRVAKVQQADDGFAGANFAAVDHVNFDDFSVGVANAGEKRLFRLLPQFFVLFRGGNGKRIRPFRRCVVFDVGAAFASEQRLLKMNVIYHLRFSRLL